MKNLLEFILIHLVDHPEDVMVEEKVGDRLTTFLIKVHEDDKAQVIGKGGSTIKAIRNVARIRALKEGIRAYVTLAE